MENSVREEIYISVDVETDGPCPGLNSMLSLGAAAFMPDSTQVISTWYATLFPLFDAKSDPETAAWWETQPEAWAEVNQNQEFALKAMPRFADWCDSMRQYGKPVAVAWPASFDSLFTTWYLHKFAGRNPLGFAWLDIRSYMNGLGNYPAYQGYPIKESKKLTGHVSKTGLREHFALDDAIEQGRTLVGLLQHAQQRAAVSGEIASLTASGLTSTGRKMK